MEGIDSGECGQRLRSAGENAHLVPKNNNEVINEVTRIINEVKNIKFYFGKHNLESLSRSGKKQLPQPKLVNNAGSMSASDDLLNFFNVPSKFVSVCWPLTCRKKVFIEKSGKDSVTTHNMVHSTGIFKEYLGNFRAFVNFFSLFLIFRILVFNRLDRYLMVAFI